MLRSSTVSQIVRAFVTAAALAAATVGCGSKDMSAGGGTTCTLDQVQAIFTTASGNTGCTVIGACHDNAGSAAGQDLTAGSGWQNKLVGMGPVAGRGASMALQSMCAGMNRMYLIAGSKPAAGLMIDKIDPSKAAPCGAHMPNLPPALTPAQFQCVQSYLTTLTSP
jgi:hypothetical protein